MFRRIRDLFASGERLLFSKMVEMLALCEESLGSLGAMIEEAHKDPHLLRERMERIGELEKEGDALSFDLTQSITSGAIAPGLTEHFFTLIHSIDDILDKSHFLARDIVRISTHAEALGTDTTVHVYRRASEMHDLCVKGVLKLKETVGNVGDGFDATMERAREIEQIEETADDIKEEIFDSIYEDVEEVDWWIFEHVLGLIHRLDDISDLSEDGANEVIMILTTLGA